ncbi:MAG TPA: PAS domain S-box protein [Usitatibacter sp.]|nr:PAS domain S-box protein [Usitatibacter sp.]
MENNDNALPLAKGPWPEPRVRALQVEEIYRFAPTATGFSYFGALLTLGVLIEIGDIGPGAVWFLWATAVTFFRSACIVAYRRRGTASRPDGWANLALIGNFLAGVQWGVLGTVLFPDGPVYLQLFTLMVIICFVAGSVPAYASVRGAHEALSLPATVPTSIYLFFVHTGVHWYAGVMALFFCFAIVHYARKLSRDIEQRLRLQVERDDLLTLTGMLNERLERENRDLAHRVAVRGASMTSARERAERFEALFERSALPQIECDAEGRVLACNPAAEKLFGVRHQEIAHRPLTTLLDITDVELREITHKDHAEIFVVKARAGAGKRVPCRASFTPLPEIEGRMPGFGMVLTGIPAFVVE